MTVDLGNSTLFIAVLSPVTASFANFSTIRWENASEGNEHATGVRTRLLNLSSSTIASVLYPSGSLTASTAALPPPSVSIIRNAADDAGSSLLVKFDDGTTDLITFAACATGELASVTRSGKIIGNITSRDIDMNRSQGHVGLTTLDAGKQ